MVDSYRPRPLSQSTMTFGAAWRREWSSTCCQQGPVPGPRASVRWLRGWRFRLGFRQPPERGVCDWL